MFLRHTLPPDLSFQNVKQVLSEVEQEYQESLNKGLLYPQVAEKTKEILNSYQPKIIKDSFVLIHGDTHPENFIQTENGLKVIHLDMCQLGLAFFELRMILHAACMPANLVAENLERYYPEGFLIDWFRGIVAEYPEILPSDYLPEIHLIALLEILQKFNLPDNIGDKDTPRKRAMKMFEMVFVAGLV